jgi:uncharacterized protein YjeT (DUF2065 family)
MITEYLATVIGWYLVAVSLFMLFRQEQMKPIITDVMEQRGLLFVLAIITFILGLLMVTSHNIWVMGWPVVVTVFSWLVLLSGLLRLFCPDTVIKMGKSFLDNPIRMKIAGVVSLVVGLYLLFHIYCPQYCHWFG